jgi:hypothetical protein
MLVSGGTFLEAVLPEFTLWELAFEGPRSVVLQDMATIFMTSKFARSEPANRRVTQRLVEGLTDVLRCFHCREGILAMLLGS